MTRTLVLLHASTVRWLAHSGAYVGLIVAAVVTFGVMFTVQVGKNPLRLDEVDYFRSIKNLAEIGVPFYYAGEVSYDPDQMIHLSTRELDGKVYEFYRFRPETGIKKEAYFALVDGQSRFTYAMWHPPLYIYLASIAFRLFPIATIDSHLLRYFNLVFSLGIAIGMAKLSQVLYSRRTWPVYCGALFLYVLNSLTLRGSSLLDYNATLAPCATVWFAVSFVRAIGRRRVSLELVLVTALSCFVGFGVITTVLVGVVVWTVAFRQYRNALMAIASVALGCAVFLPAFWLFCILFDLPFVQPFIYNFWRSGLRPANPWMAGRVEMAVRYLHLYSREIGLSVVLGVSAVFLRGCMARYKDSSHALRALPAVLAFGGLTVHAVVGANAWGFMKYILFALPLLSLYLVGESTALSEKAPHWGRVLVGLLLLVVAVTEAVGTFAVLKQPGGNLYLSEEQGVTEVAHAVQLRSTPNDVILSPKDVAFFADRRFVELSGWQLADPVVLGDVVDRYDVRYLIQNVSAYHAMSDAVLGYLDRHFSSETVIGSYVLLSRNP